MDWKELFPVESIAPLLGGIALWFGLNYLIIGPEIIGPRLAEKYYRPACMTAMAQGRDAWQLQMREARATGESRIQTMMQELAGQMQAQAQASVGSMMGMMFGGSREGARLMDRHGSQMGNWAQGMITPGLQAALQQRFNQERQALDTLLRTQEREMQQGVVHRTPAPFCGCIVTEGMKDRIDLAAFTASLRLYTPGTIRRLEDGSMITATQACGTPPIV